MNTVLFPYGDDALPVTFDESDATVHLIDSATHVSKGRSLSEAISHPLGTPNLQQIIDGKRVAVILPDITRKMPMPIPPFIIPYLRGAKEVRFIFGLGLHRKMSNTEEKTVLGNLEGSDVDYRIEQHDPNTCTYIGTTLYKTPLSVYTPVVEADVRIAIGRVDYHYYAGFTGGYKAILPGVSSKESILANHRLMMEDGALPGKLDGPVRKDIDSTRKLLPIDFLLNIVVAGGKIVHSASGDPILAHRDACAYLDSNMRVNLPFADVAVVSAGGNPKDINLFQAHKALENVQGAIKRGGAVILIAKCPEGMGNDVFSRWVHKGLEPDEVISKLKEKFEFGGHKLARLAMLRKRFELYLISDLPDNIAERCYFTPCTSVEEAMEMALRNRKLQNRKNIIAVRSGDLLLNGIT